MIPCITQLTEHVDATTQGGLVRRRLGYQPCSRVTLWRCTMAHDSELLTHYPSDLAALCQRLIALEVSADITPLAAAVLRDTLEELAQQHEALGEARQTAEIARAHYAALFT